jgi:hypothetical protein
MSEPTGFPRSRLKAGMQIRVNCKNDEGKEWTSVGVIATPSWSNILHLREAHFIDWDCILHVELLALLPPEDYED